MLCRNKILAFFQPFLMNSFHTSFFFFIRAHTVYTAHKDIAKYSAIGGTGQQIQIQVKARIGFKS